MTTPHSFFFFFQILFLLVLFTVLVVINPASAAGGTKCGNNHRNRAGGSAALFIFGDSYFDPGNYINTTALDQANFWPYGESYFNFPTGRFSNGRLISDFIAEYAQLPLIPPFLSLEMKNTGTEQTLHRRERVLWLRHFKNRARRTRRIRKGRRPILTPIS